MNSKSASHPGCSFANSASSVLSGVMVSLTPVFEQKVPRSIELSQHVEFKNVIHMFNVLNEVLSKAEGFSNVPETRKECKILSFPANQRHKQYVLCPEQDCENLVYHCDQERSMIEVLKLANMEFWEARVKAFHAWYAKSGSKTQKEAWTWEGKDSQNWSRGSSKRPQSVESHPESHPADRANPCEQGLQWKDIGEANMEESFLYPNQSSDPPRPVVHQQAMFKEDRQKYMQWIETLDLDRRTTTDERLYCGYCGMNNHPRFTCKHFYKHRDESAQHRCTLCSAFHAPFRFPRAQCNGGCGKPNWARIECSMSRSGRGSDPSKSRLASGSESLATSTSWMELTLQDQWRRSCDTSRQCRVQTI